MKNFIDYKFFNKKMSILLFKQIYNIGFFSQNVIKKQLGYALGKADLNFIFYEECCKRNHLKFYKILKILINDSYYYMLMYNIYKNIILNKLFLKKTIRFKIGLPINGQRTKTNSKNANKRFYNNFLKKIIF